MEQLKITREILVEQFKDFLMSFKINGKEIYLNEIKGLPEKEGISVCIDLDHLTLYNEELSKLVMVNPEEAVSAASEALRQLISNVDPEYADYKERFYARFFNLLYKSTIRELRANQIGRLVEIEGVVTQASIIQAKLIKAAYKCSECDAVFYVPIDERLKEIKGVLVERCPNCRRRSMNKLLLEKSLFIDWQTIRIQEDHENLPPGRLPRSILCILTEDLVDRARPGDRVVLTGTLKPLKPPGIREKRKLSYFTYIDVNYIKARGEEIEQIDLSPKDQEEVVKLSKTPGVSKKIIDSISPSIYGLEEVKSAIALLLFGGVPKYLKDGTKIRGDINILLIGDPGTGKSQILKYVAKIAPRGLYTTGKGSTAAGLTAAVVRDTMTGGWTLEAGALVLADKGTACIDEFDKMSNEDRIAIHEGMEQQTISIAKAGIVATLNARASILAAANPAWGRYDESRSPSENINLPPTILSRFDLIFLLKDEPEKKRDEKISEFILDLHAKEGAEIKQPISPETLRKYILYARRYVFPHLTSEAMEIIREFYMKMRERSSKQQGAIAITPRQLEALIRMSEAKAKLELKKWVTKSDAEFAVRLMEYYLNELGYEEQLGVINIDKITTGVTLSRRQRLISLYDTLKEMYSQKKTPVPVEELIEIFSQTHNISQTVVKEDLRKLISSGRIMSPREGHVIPL